MALTTAASQCGRRRPRRGRPAALFWCNCVVVPLFAVEKSRSTGCSTSSTRLFAGLPVRSPEIRALPRHHVHDLGQLLVAGDIGGIQVDPVRERPCPGRGRPCRRPAAPRRRLRAPGGRTRARRTTGAAPAGAADAHAAPPPAGPAGPRCSPRVADQPGSCPWPNAGMAQTREMMATLAVLSYSAPVFSGACRAGDDEPAARQRLAGTLFEIRDPPGTALSSGARSLYAPSAAAPPEVSPRYRSSTIAKLR